MMEAVTFPNFPSKRARTGFSGTTKRPIDKNLIFISQSGTDATQETTTLFTATFPCTVVGLRWSITMSQDGGTGLCNHQWAIVIVREGLTIPTLATSDAATFYKPEADVLTFGTGTVENNQTVSHFEGSTKSMRKFQGGDRLFFIVVGIASETTATKGIVQFFCKT